MEQPLGFGDCNPLRSIRYRLTRSAYALRNSLDQIIDLHFIVDSGWSVDGGAYDLPLDSLDVNGNVCGSSFSQHPLYAAG